MTLHLRKRSFRLAGHATSIALEPAFWSALERLAESRTMSLAQLVAEADAKRILQGVPLASTLRLLALEAAQQR
ncbi:MAG: hypothetical protein RIS83_290 [Pseudomonadota bacterium]|jgi:predicted DNA-binding ribbon-helix-helix protein